MLERVTWRCFIFLTFAWLYFSSSENVSFWNHQKERPSISAAHLRLLWGLVCCLMHLRRAALTVVPSFISTVLVYPACYPWGPFQLLYSSILFSFTVHSPCLGSPVLWTDEISQKLARHLHYRIFKNAYLLLSSHCGPAEVNLSCDHRAG